MSRKLNIFKEVPAPRVNRNLFDLSHEVKMSGKFGTLYPVLLLETMPGDTIRDQMIAQVRFAPMLAPIMHRLDVKTDFFFVPMRLITDHWEDFITGGQDGTEEVILPYLTPETIAAGLGAGQSMRKGKLWDYLGLPVVETPFPSAYNTEQISALPFRAYQKIWNDWFRDPNLDDEKDIDTETTGNVSAASLTKFILDLNNRGWERDMFTGALPFAQRGAEVLMPLAGTGTITYKEVSNVYEQGGTPFPVNTHLTAGAVVATDLQGTTNVKARIENIDDVSFDGGTTTINDFRTSLAIQRWLENNARGGGRYIEQIEAHFGQRVPDYRLQRTEYLGGGRQPVTISEVLSTAEGVEVPVGDMAGHGISVGKTNRFNYRCQEHGYIIGILSVVPRTAYMQGIEKLWSRTNKYDFAFPELAHLGEQEVKSKEVYFDFTDTEQEANQQLFGYVPRYAEYKFKQDRVSGDFRESLLFWHLGRKFTERPSLDSLFVKMVDDNGVEETSRRIFAVEDGTDYLWMQLYHNLTAKRPLPYFGVPRLNG